jgi:hypothetical protein
MPLRTMLNTIEAEDPSAAAALSEVSFQLALYERDPAGAVRALANIPSEGYIDFSNFPFPHAWYEGLLAKLRQDAPAAHSAFITARAETEKLVHAQPGNEKPLSVLALIDAELGEKEKAIPKGRTACDMLPVSKDALDGVALITNLARIYALTGEKDLALEQLDIVSKFHTGHLMATYVLILSGIHCATTRASKKSSPPSRRNKQTNNAEEKSVEVQRSELP